MTEGGREDLGGTGLPWGTRHCRHHPMGRGLRQRGSRSPDGSRQRTQARVAPPQGSPVSVSAAGRLSVGRPHEPLWLIEYWLREFHHHADPQATQGKQRILSDTSAGEGMYYKTRVLTPIPIQKNHLIHSQKNLVRIHKRKLGSDTISWRAFLSAVVWK